MRCLIILAFVAAAQAFWEPQATTPYCLICSDPTVKTYDGAYLALLNTEEKFMLSKWVDANNIYDSCRFVVRGVTSFDLYSDNANGPLFLDWIGVNVHVHSNPKKNFRSWIFAQRTDAISERGQGFQGDVQRYLPWTFPIPGETLALAPACSDQYEVFADNIAGYGPGIKLRSNCCPWAIDWFPNGRQTCMKIYIDQKYQGATTGICGNSNMNADDDWTDCNGDACAQNTAGCLNQISSSCESGKHNGQAFKGGLRI